MSIFLVDDSDIDRHIFRSALKSVDSSVELQTAVNGEEALALLKSSDADVPSVIFTDLYMPNMGGKTFIDELRKNEKLSHIPVIVYSTSGLAIDKKTTIENGAVHYIEKQGSFSALCSELRSILPLFFL